MTDDLKHQLRALVESTPPVSAREAIKRAEARRTPLGHETVSARGRVGRPALVVAGVFAVAGAAVGWAVATQTSPPTTPRSALPHAHRPPTILTAAELRTIVRHSSAASASSGTAEVTEASAENGVPQDGYDTAVTFSGSNIDERITSIPEPPGSASSFTTDDRFVHGQFYIYTAGPSGVVEWMHDTNSANDAASMQFPDPRVLYRAISPSASFMVVGTTSVNGVSVTELDATDPSAIDSSALGGLDAQGSLTGFDLWVDADGVVQKIALSTSTTQRVCRFEALTKSQREELLKDHLARRVATANGGVEWRVPFAALKRLAGASCGPLTITSNVTVAFANLGVPQNVTAPAGSVDFQGKG